MERFHAQVVQRLQAELNETREQSQMPKGSGKERHGAREERQAHAANHVDLLQREGVEETGAKASIAINGGVVRGNPIILSHRNMEAAVPVYIPLDNSIKVVGLILTLSNFSFFCLFLSLWNEKSIFFVVELYCLSRPQVDGELGLL